MIGTIIIVVLILIVCLWALYLPASKPKAIVVEERVVDRTDLCPSCGGGVRFFDHLDDVLQGDARIYHEFLKLKGVYDNPTPFIRDSTRRQLKHLVIPTRMRAWLDGECYCLRVSLKDQQIYLETPEGERRFLFLQPKEKKNAATAGGLEGFLWADANLLEYLIESKVFRLRDEEGSVRLATIDINMPDFIRLRDAIVALHQTLRDLLEYSVKADD
jgi:hypothetical protein